MLGEADERRSSDGAQASADALRVLRVDQTQSRDPDRAYAQRYRDSDARAAALPIWLTHDNTTQPQLYLQPTAHQPRAGPAAA